jgi:uncharacterized membrane protein YfcA
MRIPEAMIGPADLWSFKETYTGGWHRGESFVINVHELWFARYWSQGGGFGVWVGPGLIFLFEAQVVTLLVAALAIHRVKPHLFLASAILSAFTVCCMWFVAFTMSRWYDKTFQAGFGLAWCSAAVFVAAVLTSRRQHPKRQRAPTTEGLPAAPP